MAEKGDAKKKVDKRAAQTDDVMQMLSEQGIDECDIEWEDGVCPSCKQKFGEQDKD